jgi:hypothetical protein
MIELRFADGPLDGWLLTIPAGPPDPDGNLPPIQYPLEIRFKLSPRAWADGDTVTINPSIDVVTYVNSEPPAFNPKTRTIHPIYKVAPPAKYWDDQTDLSYRE